MPRRVPSSNNRAFKKCEDFIIQTSQKKTRVKKGLMEEILGCGVYSQETKNYFERIIFQDTSPTFNDKERTTTKKEKKDYEPSKPTCSEQTAKAIQLEVQATYQIKGRIT